ncbi:MAG: substrate-binding domain-containing protein [Psychromonas sp.]|nr:substrate-binding domain-containing protein [Alteromonadales bacterium]MCP5076485.1 substrate-binding domain-containing protein [Psychromonas sp.]
MKQLKQKGILTVYIDRDIGGERLSVLKTNNLSAGRLAGKEMVKALKGEGKVAVLRYRNSVSTTNEREKGFIEEVVKGGLKL